MYHQLAEVHQLNHRVTLTELLRAAYMHKFGKELPVNSLRADMVKYINDQVNPDYLNDFLIGIYGCH